MPAKPLISDVHGVLLRHRALIVHFSGAPKGAGSNYEFLFPQDLQHAIQGHASGGLSCSLVMPGDKFSGMERNATGCVGIVLDLTTPDSLVAVAPHDCGSIVCDGVRVVPNEIDITVADLERTIDERTSYNEWVLRNFRVLGVFAAPPNEVSCREQIQPPEDMPSYLRPTEPDISIRAATDNEIRSLAGSLPIFQFANGQIHALREGYTKPLDHSEIYPLAGTWRGLVLCVLAFIGMIAVVLLLRG